MGTNQTALSRKSFLQLTGVVGLAGSLPHRITRSMGMDPAWPVLNLRKLPQQMQAILCRVPRLEVDPQGFLTLQGDQDSRQIRLPMAQTQWNLEHSNRWDRLEQDTHWGIVLHWYGDEAGYDRSVEGYLRGFNSLRQVANYTTRTSAHVLVGRDIPSLKIGSDREAISVLQTQKPDADGNPFSASHLTALDYQGYKEKKQYFVRALYELGNQQPSIHSILQEWFYGSYVDANMRSFAIELTGCNFEMPDHVPNAQQIANAIGVVWALMRHYGIRASSILGHHEIQIEKPDPGKRFMAQVRCLLGAKALTENDAVMSELIFGQHLSPSQDPIQATQVYLQWVRDYLVLVSRPCQVYAWEAVSGYWFLIDLLNGDYMPTASSYSLPLPEAAHQPLVAFGLPGNHEGVDLYIQNKNLPKQVDIKLMTDGKCLFAGDSLGPHPGKQAIFLHRQPDGAEIVSIYRNLSGLNNLRMGGIYPSGYPIGTIGTMDTAQTDIKVLHFAIAYRNTWDKYLIGKPDAAYSADSSWIAENYLDPMEYLRHQISLIELSHKERIPNPME